MTGRHGANDGAAADRGSTAGSGGERDLGAAAERRRLDLTRAVAWGGAHDLNNLLMAISGNVSLALMDLPPDEPARESLEQIDVAARSAASLARDVMTVLPRVERPPALADLGELAGGLQRLATAAAGHGLAIRVEPLPGPLVHAEVALLRLAVLDLVLAAAEAAGTSHPVVVRTGGADAAGRPVADRDAGRAAVEVEIEGDLAAEVRAGIAATVSEAGTGATRAVLAAAVAGMLGGALVSDRDGCNVRLVVPAFHETGVEGGVDPPDSSAAGSGTIAAAAGRVAGPQATSASARGVHRESARPAPPARRPHVLVVDDEEVLRAMAPRLLEHVGATCEVAADGAEGLRLFGADPARYDLVLLDVSMPGLGGEEVLRRMHHARPGARIVLMSGYPVGDDEARLRAAGCSGFLQKPFRTDDLLEVLRETAVGRRED